MVSNINKKAMRCRRHARVRGKISGTSERLRLNEFRSTANIYAQLIDDTKGVTLAAASTQEKAVMEQIQDTDKKGAAKIVGKLIAERASQAGITKVVFDRGGYLYHGRVAELAEGAREGGLKF